MERTFKTEWEIPKRRNRIGRGELGMIVLIRVGSLECIYDDENEENYRTDQVYHRRYGGYWENLAYGCWQIFLTSCSWRDEEKVFWYLFLRAKDMYRRVEII